MYGKLNIMEVFPKRITSIDVGKKDGLYEYIE